MGNIIAIVGRPNVGKSTLFNRLTESRRSIMDDTSGVTRDRIYGQGEWTGHFFTVIDTGGYVVGSDDVFEEAIRRQAELAVEEADVILFVVDIRAGLHDLDKDFANVVRRYDKPVFLVANKTDQPKDSYLEGEFYALGLGDKIYPISSMNGSGTGDLLDDVVAELTNTGDEDPYEGIPKIAILGRPNVGKSSFLNALIGKERSIVTDQAGTTRDAINTHYKAFGHEFILIDTAGIRKKGKIKESIEFYSVLRSIRTLENADICIVMIDATRGLEAQDMNIISLAERNGKGILLMINKWDLVDKDSKTAKNFTEQIREKIAPLHYIPIIFSSVLKKQRIFQVMEKTLEVYQNQNRKVSTSELNQAMLPEIERYPPPALKGKYIKIKYITQLPTRRPHFAFFCNLPQYIKAPYVRYLENKLRGHFDFEGVPLKLLFRKK